ncbi:MAG TPA: hypothetical protein VGO62_00365, partial [Myxococcota bacterium]
MDSFQLIIDGAEYVAWPHGGGFQPVTIRVNDIELCELVRRCELPFAQAEYDERVAGGATPGDL